MKWRPQRFRQVVGQAPVTELLRRQVQRGRVAHAYLLGGPSGTGKTTVARILSAAVNCPALRGGEPCGKCPSCRLVRDVAHWDVIETNGASNRGIEDTRSLVSRSYLAPMGARKVYLVDEAHGLTSTAWEALLTVIEQPPAHLVWLFCTTAPDALPETVRSRCMTLRFNAIPPRETADYLARVARGERLQVAPAGLRFIAESSGGNLRQALTLLEQVMHTNGRRTTTRRVKQTVRNLALDLTGS